MPERSISGDRLAAYAAHLRAEEASPGTIEKYLRDVGALAAWLGGRAVTKEEVTAWRDALLARGLTPSTVNSMLAAVNGFFRFTGREDCRVKFLKVQRRLFRGRRPGADPDEYERLLAAAGNSGQRRLELLMEAICATGIRVSEVRYLTVEAARRGRAEIRLKGKIRTILIPREAVPEAAEIRAKKQDRLGEIFLTRNGTGLSRRQIWAEMKALCARAGVEPGKVFPHNLRHLFATAFYRACRDIARLADVLGHSSLETTPALSDLHRPGARPDPGAPAPADIGQNQHFV